MQKEEFSQVRDLFLQGGLQSGRDANPPEKHSDLPVMFQEWIECL
jgi:hypothetical protein